jgi:hypothetical protein
LGISVDTNLYGTWYLYDELAIDSSSWKEMVKDALDAVEVVTFDYPCESI